MIAEQELTEWLLDLMLDFEPDGVTVETLFEKTNMDSLDILWLVTDIENEFNITLDPKEYGSLTTIQSLIDVCMQKINSKSSN